LAQVGSALPAEEAFIARGGVRGHDSHTRLKPVFRRSANLFDNPGHLMAEDRRRHNHPRVVTLLPNLEIGAASERDLYFDEKVVGTHSWDWYFFDFYVFAAVQYGRHHVSVALHIHGKTTTFKESSVG